MTGLFYPSEELQMLPQCQKLNSDKATTLQPSSLNSQSVLPPLRLTFWVLMSIKKENG